MVLKGGSKKDENGDFFSHCNFFIKNSKAQVTIFIIVAVVLVAAVIGFFALRGTFKTGGIPVGFESVYTSFVSCLEENVLTGIDVLETQGGYIVLPEIDVGSRYMPFSSQLIFLGNPIPYWYYVSGNNIQKEEIPTLSFMESELSDFVESKMNSCVFDGYYEQGFLIDLSEADVKINIRESEVDVSVDMDLSLERGNDSVVVGSHDIVVKSYLGKLYDSARKVYDYEKKTLFLENYAVDTLRLYAPVDGVELTCSPMIWNADNIFDDLEEAIEENTLALKVAGGDYSLKNKEDKYFIVDIDVEEDVRFLNSRKWTNAFEVAPSDESLLMAKPVGNQPGLGILGFCYVPYHFVYSVRYPVLVQVSSGLEIFQFPLAVVVEGNRPREPLDAEAVSVPSPELCTYKNNFVSVNTYDTRLIPIDANISYECFSQVCQIGETEFGVLEKDFPQCVNGYIIARAEGYEDSRYLFSTTTNASAEIILDKLYEMDLNLKLDGRDYNREAVISFVKEDGSSKTIIYPEESSVKLSEGQYEVQVNVYRNTSLKLKESVKSQCVDVPVSGLGGLFGLTKQKCFDITIPSQIISNALSGGGKQSHYILESELESASVLEISAESLDVPKSLEDLQKNYLLFEDQSLGVSFR